VRVPPVGRPGIPDGRLNATCAVAAADADVSIEPTAPPHLG